MQGYTCDLNGYTASCFSTPNISESDESTEYRDDEQNSRTPYLLTHDVLHTFRLYPAPPKMERSSDYARLAQETHDLKYIFFFLHHHEAYINSRVSSFLNQQTEERGAERFLDMKLACRDTILRIFPRFDSNRGTSFVTFIHPYINDALLRYRMQEENWTLESLDFYKKLRRIYAIYNECKQNTEKAIAQYAEEMHCTADTAREHMILAYQLRGRLYAAGENEEGEIEEADDEIYPDSFDYVRYLWNDMEAPKIEKAFNALSYRDQTLLEQRNAICMRCGRVSPLSTRSSFEALAVMFEGSGASGAERAYRKALDKLIIEMVKQGVLHCVELRQKSVQREGKTITAAVYEYRVDSDGAWGEIQFDLVEKTAWVETFAEKDLCDSWDITDCAIDSLLDCDCGKLPKKTLLPVFPGRYLE